MDKILSDANNVQPHWTATAVLPGGDIGESITSFTQDVINAYPFLPEPMAVRLASQYGTRIHKLLHKVHRLEDLGQHFGSDLYAREVDFMLAYEWVRQPDDILFRRSRIGLNAPLDIKDKLAAVFG